jgi:hypothetical protein
VSTQWANIGDDPGALHALLQRIPEQVPVELVDQVWIFPPRRVAVGESVVVVVGAFDPDPERRRVITARFTISRSRKGVAQVNTRFDEHGTAPVPAVSRIVHGVLRRLGEDTDAEPRAELIGGRADRWDELILELGGRPAAPTLPDHDPTSGEDPEAPPQDATVPQTGDSALN